MPRPPRAKLSESSNGDPIAPSPSSSGRGPDERLPVNPRRTKVAPEQRKRVAKACNRCNQKRIKCSGSQPCQQCLNAKRECRYPPPAQKVTITKQDLDELQAVRRQYHVQASRIKALERLLEENGVPPPPPEPATQTPPPDTLDGTGAMSPSSFSPHGDVNMADALDGSPESPGPGLQEDQGKLLTDNDGTERFLGETSGANYLDGCKDFIDVCQVVRGTTMSRSSDFLASKGRYQTFDSRPLNLPSVDPLWLPPPNERVAMLADINTYFRDGNGSFASGGIFYWPWKDASSIAPQPTTSKTSNRHLAVYHAGFALSSLLRGQRQLSEQYYCRASSLLGNSLEVLYTLDDVPALVLMGLYMVENNRREFASSSISNAMHVSITHGAHRDNHGGQSPAEEGRRRTFWTVYILVRWLSCLMGRPAPIDKEAITLPLPVEVPGLPSPVGLQANIELADLSHKIVKHSYRSHKPADNRRFTKYIMGELKRWNERLDQNITLSLSKILNPPPRESLTVNKLAMVLGDHAPVEPPPVPEDDQLGVNLTEVLGPRASDRAYLTLHMWYDQLLIIAIRNESLSAVKKVIADKHFLGERCNTIHVEKIDLVENHDLSDEFRDGIEAARNNLMIGNHIKNYIKAPGNKLLVADLHHIFSAAVTLMISRIPYLNWRTGDTRLISFAKEAFKEEAKSGSAYGKDCYAVLDEMDRLVMELHAIVHGLEDRMPEVQRTLQVQYGEADPSVMKRLEQLAAWQWEEPVDEVVQQEEDEEDGDLQTENEDIEMDDDPPYKTEA